MGEDLLIRGPKQLKKDMFRVTPEGILVCQFPMDSDASVVYYATAGGFVPPRFAIDTFLSGGLRYGLSGFEGIRAYYTPYGTVMPELAHNIARLLWTNEIIQATYLAALIGCGLDRATDSVTVNRISARELYETTRTAMYEGKEPQLRFTVNVDHGSHTRQGDVVSVPFRLKVVYAGEIKEFTVFDIDTIIKLLAFFNRIVTKDHFPDDLEMALGAYFDPKVWVSGDYGLGISTIVDDPTRRSPYLQKPMYFSVATLPWGVYLREEDYKQGLDVLVAPYPRIGDDTRYAGKVGGHYVNALLNILVAALIRQIGKHKGEDENLNFGEVLVKNRDGKVVEGSAENLFTLYREEGRWVAYTPPLGDNILPGTTRDRLVRTLMGMGINVKFQSKTVGELKQASAIILCGTGAQLIHVNSITENDEVDHLIGAISMLSEDTLTPRVTVGSLLKAMKRTVINGGKKHPIVDEIRRGYVRYVIGDSGSRLDPVYNIHPDALERVLSIPLGDFTTDEERNMLRGGAFGERVNGLTHPDELASKTASMARILSKGLKVHQRKLGLKV